MKHTIGLLLLASSIGVAADDRGWPHDLGEVRGEARVEGFGCEPTDPLCFLVSKPELQSRWDEQRRGWDGQERSLLWSLVALSAMDAYQTIHKPDDNYEANPVVSSWAGDDPSAVSVVLFKSAATYGLTRLVRRSMQSGKKRKRVLWVLNALQFSVVAHNERVTGGVITP